ncbi:Erg28 [Pyrrhoderma noxium]|uniref:Erg28 n=1 Tax=Pyrrhoderma noxium TaxID=2282107 RepID=A0A286U9C6_9AGAM|nr:Erg28 [Pyrrhoderma noxium]
MIIPINLHPESSKDGSKFPPQLAKLGTDEIILLELQGSFHTEGDAVGQQAAKLNLENENKPTLLVGHNLLEGKVVNLSKPLGVLVKKEVKEDPDFMHVDSNEEEGEGNLKLSCKVNLIKSFSCLGHRHDGFAGWTPGLPQSKQCAPHCEKNKVHERYSHSSHLPETIANKLDAAYKLTAQTVSLSSTVMSFANLIPNTPGLLPKWQLIVAGAALFNTVQCLLTTKLTRKVYNKTPDVTALQARTFAVWTLTSAIVRFYAAYHINDKIVYDMALFTYLIAFGHFSSELLITRTAKLFPGAISPVIVSTTSLIWMLLQYDYYVN